MASKRGRWILIGSFTMICDQDGLGMGSVSSTTTRWASLCSNFSREGIAVLLSFSHITFLFDGDTGVYMKVSAGWCVPPTLLVVASDDIVILAGFPGGPVPGTRSRTLKLAMMA